MTEMAEGAETPIPQPGEPSFERLQQLLAGFSLSVNEARILTGMIRLGWATPTQLSKLTGVNRPNVYPLLDSLASKKLVERHPGATATWVSAAPEEVVARLEAAEAERLDDAQRALQHRTSETRGLVATLFKGAGAGSPAVSIVEEVQAGIMYEEAVVSVRDEILVFNRGPYIGEIAVSPKVLDALGRGVQARAIYQLAELGGADGNPLSRSADAYVSAGVLARVADELDVSMAVLDRTLAFVSVPGDEDDDLDYPTNLAINNKWLGKLLGQAFDHVWEHAQPYRPSKVQQPTTSEKRTGSRAVVAAKLVASSDTATTP